MSDTIQPPLRARGKQAIALAAQELAWARNIPLGRIDWTPDPEMEEGTASAYLLTLLTDAHEVQETLTGEFLDSGWQDRTRLKEALAPLIDALETEPEV
ncbi:MAG: hypothetical protein P8009_06820 [Gammaproteobacteria bacterium]